MFRTRQAPSPTGYLHLGTARQVLFTALFAHKNQGKWFLRLEDTDQKRLQLDAAKKLLQTLKELGLLPQEGITLPDTDTNQKSLEYESSFDIYQTGDYGPYIQSQRLSIYHFHAQKLIDKKLAYWSFLSEEEKNELSEIKKVNKKAINFFKNSNQKTEENMYLSVEEGLKHEQNPVLRYRLQREKILECHDELLGKTKFDLSLEEDFTILKSDGFPTYHLAHLVDDFLMQTSLVIRAQEWFASLPKHIAMFRDYWGNMPDEELQEIAKKHNINPTDFEPSKNGKNVPSYIHLPFILGETGNKKMSKRDGNVNMQTYLDQGFLPEAILNYLAFLGWNPGGEQEIFLESQDLKSN